MRHSIHAVLISLVLMAGCKHKVDKAQVPATDEGAPSLATLIHVADAQTSSQLVSGFYEVEQNSWRWTKRRFSVRLRPPVDSERNGATLTLKFVIPDVIVERLKSMSLAASVGGVSLPPEKYSKSGEHVYVREVPGASLTGKLVTVDFVLDKALPPTSSEARELGVVVSSIGLEPK